MQLSDLNLLIRNNAIWFKFLSQKRDTNKLIASALYDKN